jgi:hypothetical protein
VSIFRINTGYFCDLGGVKKRSVLMMRRRMALRGVTIKDDSPKLMKGKWQLWHCDYLLFSEDIKDSQWL